MTVLLPRLDREQTSMLIDAARDQPISEIAACMPERNVVTTSSELGGLEIDDEDLVELRDAVLGLASEHGFPDPPTALSTFEGRCARLLHAQLGISPHEAAEERVWSHLTVCWLMDVAVWRWSGIGDDRRFRGDVNRNTFRRLWWRAEVFGPDLDLTEFGEDEFVNIMERPTIAANRRLTRTLATAFLERLGAEPQGDRMMLMRDACKHIVRLTPIVDLYALTDRDLRALLDAILDAAAAGAPLGIPAVDDAPRAPEPSEGVEELSELAAVDIVSAELGAGGHLPPDVAELANIAIGIARRAGRVTSVTLCETVPLEMPNARRLLQGLVERGELSRHGRTKGTYYVIPDSDDLSGHDGTEDGSEAPSTQQVDRDEIATESAAPIPSDRSEASSLDHEAEDAPDVLPPTPPSSRPPPSWPPASVRHTSAYPPTQAARDALRRLLRRR